jgi:hypothetical protein
VGVVLQTIGYRLYRLSTSLILSAGSTALTEELSRSALKLAGDLTERGIHFIETAALSFADLYAEWKRMQEDQSPAPAGVQLTISMPITTIHPVRVEQVRDELFESGLEVHRLGRQLYFLARRFEVSVSEFDIGDDEAEPGPLHLPWRLAECCDGGHGELWYLANQLIAASKATMHPADSPWNPDNYDFDENRILA